MKKRPSHPTFGLAPFLVLGRLEAGCDEAGRGCLAGPVTAAAVVLDAETARRLIQDHGLNDSKVLTQKKREQLRPLIESLASSWAVSFLTPEEIDEMNILRASFEAMGRAVRKLTLKPEHLLIDGDRFYTSASLPGHTCIVKGDSKFASIASAGILAKTHRDDFMRGAAIDYPAYGWTTNKGYPTAVHREAIRQHGPTPLHRKSFRLLPEQPSFDLV